MTSCVVVERDEAILYPLTVAGTTLEGDEGVLPPPWNLGVQKKEQKGKQTIYYLLPPLNQNPNVVSYW